MKTIYSIIPARAGSKGVPGKNIKQLGGHPLIAYSIAASLNTPSISRTLVSTDSNEIATIAKNLGAEVPFLRPADISGDRSTDFEFVIHVLKWLQEVEGNEPDLLVHLRPTTPLRDPKVIQSAIDKFLAHPNATSLRSVHIMAESAYKCFEIESELLKSVGSGSFELDQANQARQLFPTTYSANGYVDILRTEFIRKTQKLHGNRVLAFDTPKVTEVDSIQDFEMLEYQVSLKPTKISALFP